jgi:hypothetical protein
VVNAYTTVKARAVVNRNIARLNLRVRVQLLIEEATEQRWELGLLEVDSELWEVRRISTLYKSF